jgi:hypothetical protein
MKTNLKERLLQEEENIESIRRDDVITHINIVFQRTYNKRTIWYDLT